MTLDRTVAHFVTHRPRLVYAAVFAAVILSAILLLYCLRLDSDVLDLLPRKFDSVRSFKIFDRDFTQAHELTFALWDENHEADLDSFTDHFGEMLKREPWV